MIRRLLLPWLALAVLALSACGSDAESDSGDDATDTPPPPSGNPDAALPAPDAPPIAPDAPDVPDAGDDVPVDAGADAADIDAAPTPDGPPVGDCQPGDVYTRACGNCGTMTRTCVDGRWGDWSECRGQGECAAGDSDTEGCGSDVGACSPGTRGRTCSDSCQWQDWSGCAGDGYQPPVPEQCNDRLDNDCNGAADEGCACTPVAMGRGSSFVVAGNITKLVADPNRCFVYALNAGNPSQVVVIDTASKRELSRVALPQAASDIDIGADGTLLVSHDAAHQISIIDTQAWASRQVPTQSDPYAIEAGRGGLSYYVELDQWTNVRRIDLGVGTGSDTVLSNFGTYAGDAELSSDGRFLYVGESGISGGSLVKFDVSGATATKVDESTYDDGYGFPYPPRHVFLSPGGQHVYYAAHQLDALELSTVRGRTGERVLTGDTLGTFAIGEQRVFDAELVRSVGRLPQRTGAAVLTSGDRELWRHSPVTGRVYYESVDDYVWGVRLGEREIPALPLTSYRLTRLVHDPARARLYGLDSTAGVVVAIDATTLTPIAAVVVGSTPTDIDVSPDGATLWVGHLDTLALARIDLAGFTFGGFVPTPRNTFEIEAVAGGRVATIDDDQWTTPTLIDGETGAVLAERSWGAYQGALDATADGAFLFVGESSLSGSNLVRYNVSGGTLTAVDQTDYGNGYGFPYPSRAVAALPDGSAIFYAKHLLDGGDLSVLRYPIEAVILAVTPDGRLAMSSTHVYDVTTGAARGELSASGTVQAVSPDSATLFVASEGQITRIPLAPFRP